MKQLTVSLILSLCLSFSSLAQQAKISGVINDTAEKKPLQHSVVALLRAKDSTFFQFTRSDAAGKFNLANIPAGSYLLLVTHPNFADYYLPVSLIANEDKDLKQVPMILRSQLLQEVVVRQQLGAIRLKKDTTEYVADSFKVAANANVEELLKRLPGVQVDKDGKIKAQGEEVKKVLVDGEEFFGDDPTMATQNLRADAVEKVQVFDKQSDQAAFTGVDDGQKTKTINLKLKEDKKNGYFGKLSLGGGLKDRFTNQAMINAFKGKRKFAAFGIMSNTGRTGLGWQDQGAYGGGDNSNVEFDEGSGMMFMYSEGDEFGGGGSFYGEGLPTSWAAGLHFSNKYNEDKHKLNFSYRFNKLNTIGGGGTISQFIQPDTTYYSNDNGNNFSQRIKNSLNGTYEWQLDSFSSLKLTFNGSIGKTLNKTYSYSELLTEEKDLVNQGFRNTDASGDNQAFNSTALYRRKFRKKGRTISINLAQNYSNSATDGFLQSKNFYYSKINPLRTDTVDQKKINNNDRLSWNAKASYTEPLSKNVNLEINYGLSNSNSESERITYNKSGTKYTDRVDSLSSDYGFKIFTQTAGANLRVTKKKYNFGFGGNISNSDFKQTDLLFDTARSYNYLNFFPKANFNWNIKPQTRFSIRYNGNTTQPNIEQLQPLRDNNNPLNIRKGNPNLTQEFRHDFSLNFSDFKVMNNRAIWMFANFTTISNAISSSESFDSLGRRIYMPVNVKGNKNYSVYSQYNIKIKKTDFYIGINLNTYGNEFNTIAQGKNSKTISRSIMLGPNISYRKEKKMEFNLQIEPTFNSSRNSLSPSLNNDYWSTAFNGSLKIYVKKKFEIGTDIDANFRQRTPLFQQNRNVFLWNGYAGWKVFKGETGLIRFEVKDLLNQNIGFSRNISSNNITERTYETLRRFWLLSFTWNFNKNGKAPGSAFEIN